ncbi:hypothetical protein Pint_36025 [Pistacia integerrima]|uniref:Uncharacterized protein n=1 Tax=Pistacia integerrima TaxID=434235 RepID=A0ACC0Y4I3_9ROSI|nr:hypothetical protein Pint_36025 [Pistacia integerrima]
MEGIPHPIPRTVEEVFDEFKGRRAGLIKALTIDVEKFYQQCDPGGFIFVFNLIYFLVLVI